uniref:Uncharacterized protein n=1 Tax=Arundo donax TaxID=35708 RepID=A0A0A8YW81_ARUDO
MKPLATSRALCLITTPASFFLSLNTHFRVIGRCPGGRSTNSQVPFRSTASSSFLMAARHAASSFASANKEGSPPAAKSSSLCSRSRYATLGLGTSPRMLVTVRYRSGVSL